MQYLLFPMLVGVLWLWGRELGIIPQQPPQPPPPQISQSAPSNREIKIDIEIPERTDSPEREDSRGSGRNHQEINFAPVINNNIDLGELEKLKAPFQSPPQDKSISVDIGSVNGGEYVGNPSGKWRELRSQDSNPVAGCHFYRRQTCLDPDGFIVVRNLTQAYGNGRGDFVAQWNRLYGDQPLGHLKG